MSGPLEFTGDEVHDEFVVRSLIAIGVVAGDLSASEIARFGRVHPSTAQQALTSAIQQGILNSDGSIDEERSQELCYIFFH
jgi:hypothetical protein